MATPTPAPTPRSPARPPTAAGRQTGTSLLEALISLLVVAVGLLGSAQWHLRLRQAVDLARQQSEAGRLAQYEIERLRGLAAAEPQAGQSGLAAIGDRAGRDRPVGRRQYRFPDRAGGARWSWRRAEGHRGHRQLARSPRRRAADARWPARSATRRRRWLLPLRRPAAGREAAPVLGRHVAIPRDAHDLGDGRSVFKPLTGGDIAWLFDNRSAPHRRAAAPQCRRPRRTASSAPPTWAIALDSNSVLLGGRVRFSLAPPPAQPDCQRRPRRAARPGNRTAPVEQRSSAAAGLLRRGGAGRRYRCRRQPAADRGRRGSDAGQPGPWRMERERRPLLALPLRGGAAGSAPNRADPAPHWSGRLHLTPHGWTHRQRHAAATGSAATAPTPTAAARSTGRPNCRPASSRVDEALVEQNLLVVDGAQACPAAAAVERGGRPRCRGHDANPATVAHQP